MYLQRIWMNYWQSKPVIFERPIRNATVLFNVNGKSMNYKITNCNQKKIWYLRANDYDTKLEIPVN